MNEEKTHPRSYRLELIVLFFIHMTKTIAIHSIYIQCVVVHKWIHIKQTKWYIYTIYVQCRWNGFFSLSDDSRTVICVSLMRLAWLWSISFCARCSLKNINYRWKTLRNFVSSVHYLKSDENVMLLHSLLQLCWFYPIK